MNGYALPFERSVLVRGERPKGPLVAYDLETTRIPRNADETMRVRPLYITGHGAAGPFVSRAIDGVAGLAHELRKRFFIGEMNKARYCAWNGNRFDARLVMDAIADHLGDDFGIDPFVAANAGLRGARVYRRGTKLHWYLLDAIAMTGLVGRKLAWFLSVFAPDFEKGTLDFETTDFDARNPAHVAYAERDSEGLYHGLCRANAILANLTGRGLQVTIGNAGIKFFASQLPEGVQIWPVPRWADSLVAAAKRGGYVAVERPYSGPVWQYDVNQAYAAAMRECDLPHGRSCVARRFDPNRPGIYHALLSRERIAPFPFYARTVADDPDRDRNGRHGGRAIETYGEGVRCAITSDEYRFLVHNGWEVIIDRGIVWEGAFRLGAMVDRLEALRRSCEGGPSGPTGTMIKAIGNHSYGKTGEIVPPFRIVIDKVRPHEKAQPFAPDGDPLFEAFWIVPEEGRTGRNYHRPQIAAFITASVRCKLYAAIAAAPDAFVKADTDSVAFTRPVDHLPVSSWEYGAWKLEHSGADAIVIGKKVYAIAEGPDRWHFVCKALRTDRLRLADFERWFSQGEPPAQEQIQNVSWRRGLGDRAPMYVSAKRRGTDFRTNASVLRREAAREAREA